jgi:hypothetical protein
VKQQGKGLVARKPNRWRATDGGLVALDHSIHMLCIAAQAAAQCGTARRITAE